MPNQLDNIPPEKRGNPAWVKGMPSPNPGGRPRVLRDIEAMLDAEFRTVEDMRRAFTRLRALALGELVEIHDKKTGELIRIELKAAPEFMKMYLERLLGPVRELQADLTDAPKAVVDWISENLA